eukprot:TRINITY_DN13081_c0_g2_i1.p1 TRINITY_DN13081_c0_g2~~TRINITY_DN13081_c0_g2_i1.p1  ORF type:complete len:345 (-),score=26.48 TRINITY_DN13081_c0_g2_i1:59-1045(-)
MASELGVRSYGRNSGADVEITKSPHRLADTPEVLWPVERPSLVMEVRAVSQGCMLVFLSLFIATLMWRPSSEARRWLASPWICWPYILAFCGGVFYGLWLLCTCPRDPGYLKRNPTGPEEPLDQSEIDDHGNDPYAFEISVPLHWCKVCRIHQPRRTKHCKECGYCVCTFDHHCFWIGGCVGEFNHRRFYQMLLVWTVLLIWFWSLLRTTGEPNVVNPFLWVSRSWPSVVMMCIVILYLVFAAGLLVYHTYLIATAQTTWEHLSRRNIDYMRPFPRTVFPFSAGVRRNFFEFFCHRGRGKRPKEWLYGWHPGEPIPFNIFENKYWSCC